MKKIFRIAMAFVAVLFSLNVNAQDPSKEVVLIDAFTMTQSNYTTVRDNVRAAVMQGFSDIGRFEVIDILSDSRLSELVANRGENAEVSADNWMKDNVAMLKSLNAKKLVRGQITLLREYSKYDGSGDRVYYSNVNYTLQVFDLENGTALASENYTYDELSVTSYVDAFGYVLKKIGKDMVKFCNDHFKVKTYILELGEADKKGLVSTMWISGGTNIGFSKGTIFSVKLPKKIGPKVMMQEIGKIIAEEVTEDITLCKVMGKKAEVDAVMAAFRESQNGGPALEVELEKKRDTMGAIGGFLGL